MCRDYQQEFEGYLKNHPLEDGEAMTAGTIEELTDNRGDDNE